MKKSWRMQWIWIVVVALVFGLSGCAAQKQLGPLTAKDMVADAKVRGVKEIAIEQTKKDIESGNKLVVLDVREPEEFKKGHLPKAVNSPRGLLEFTVEKAIPDKNAYVIVYCKTGGRSCLAADTLMKMGYKNAVSMAGGWDGWFKAGYPVE